MLANQMVRADFGDNIKHLVVDMLSLRCLLGRESKQTTACCCTAYTLLEYGQ